MNKQEYFDLLNRYENIIARNKGEINEEVIVFTEKVYEEGFNRYLKLMKWRRMGTGQGLDQLTMGKIESSIKKVKRHLDRLLDWTIYFAQNKSQEEK